MVRWTRVAAGEMGSFQLEYIFEVNLIGIVFIGCKENEGKKERGEKNQGWCWDFDLSSQMGGGVF